MAHYFSVQVRLRFPTRRVENLAEPFTQPNRFIVGAEREDFHAISGDGVGTERDDELYSLVFVDGPWLWSFLDLEPLYLFMFSLFVSLLRRERWRSRLRA
jgi:hypothetical protein